MGNPRFKLSDMMPNAWFYKLRDMSKSKHQNTKTRKLVAPQKTPRKSYYHSTQSRLVIHDNYSIPPTNPKPFSPSEPPRRSSKKRAKRKTIYMPSPRQKSPCHSIFRDDENTPASLEPRDLHLELADSFLNQSDFDSLDEDGLCAADIIIDVDRISYSNVTELNMVSELDDLVDLKLPPIATKPRKSCTPAGPKKIKTGHGARKSVSRKVKIRGNHGPSRKTEKSNGGRKSGEKLTGLFYSESLAIVKASVDPERDFRESMMEMIVENNIRASKDLEDLLACYLSLNSNQYHGLIIKAFEQIWFNMLSKARFG